MSLTLPSTQVLAFGQQQKTLVATMRRFSVMKKDSSMARDIKRQAENLRQRLEAQAKQVQNAEEQQGPAAVAARIQRSQHAALYRKFQQVGHKVKSDSPLSVQGRGHQPVDPRTVLKIAPEVRLR